jgi:STE24 endopeptidase
MRDRLLTQQGDAQMPGLWITTAAQAAGGFDVEAATRAWLAVLDGPTRAKSDAYFEGGYWLILWNALVAIAVYLLLLATGWSARFRALAERVTRRAWLVPAVYAVLLSLATSLLFLPWSIYVEFVREGQYGLSNQTFGAWLRDWGIATMLGVVFNPLLAIGFYAAIRRAPRSWWLWGTGVLAGFIAIAVAIGPVFIAPLFNTYSEMPAGPLRDRIVAVAQANHIPAEHIYVSDASRQSKRISANVSGLGPTIRITLNDNLLKRTGPDEVEAVMGHEMGHYVLGHIWKSIALFALVIGLILFAFSRIAPRLIARHPRWGVRSVADPAGAPVLLLLGSVAGVLLTPVQNTIVRVHESEADAFGLDAARPPDGFAKTALRLSEYRKLEPGPLEEAIFFDHPSGETRIRMAMQWKKDNVPGATMAKPELVPAP